jgi:hypothetical protein
MADGIESNSQIPYTLLELVFIDCGGRKTTLILGSAILNLGMLGRLPLHPGKYFTS